MKKLIISIIFALGFGMSLNAQSDGFFSSDYSEYREANSWDVENMPLLPGSHGSLGDYDCVTPAPLGSGVLILAGFGFAYMVSRRKVK